MKKRTFLVIAIFLLMGVSFWIGTKTGRYLFSVMIENQYPHHLREIWINNQPTCEDYKSLTKGEKPFLADFVKDKQDKVYFKIVSKPSKTQEGKLIYSILNKNQEQFIDELWLDCR